MLGNTAWYISGHGFGHAARAAEVLRVLSSTEPGLTFHVRTTAPSHFFSVPPETVLRVESVSVDSGVVERDPLHVDPALTLERAASFVADKDRIIRRELAFVKEQKISLIVGDMPYLVGDIAQAAGLPCVAIGNFSWDWIYEPFVTDLPAYRFLTDTIQCSYKKISRLLMLPFSDQHALKSLFSSVTDVPLLARRSRRVPEEIMHDLRLDPSDPRPVVLIGMRGGLPPDRLASAARVAKDWLFLTSEVNLPSTEENVYPLVFSPALRFVDVLKACTVVIAKLGYGIVADSTVNGARLLFVPRSGFREDEILEREAPRNLRIRKLPLLDYEQGAWSEHLNLLLHAPSPTAAMPEDGAEVCANLIAKVL